MSMIWRKSQKASSSDVIKMSTAPKIQNETSCRFFFIKYVCRKEMNGSLHDFSWSIVTVSCAPLTDLFSCNILLNILINHILNKVDVTTYYCA